MKFAELVSIGHNLATSASDGDSVLFDTRTMDLHGAALQSPRGRVIVDFITGRILEGEVSTAERVALSLSPGALETLCLKHGATVSDFAVLQASYGVDEVYGPHFTVVVEGRDGQRSEELYQGISGRRLRRGHRTGGVRT